MKAPLKVISEFGCPTDSYISAVQHLAQQTDVDKAEYERRIQEIIGLLEPPECQSWYVARVLFMYVVQETIREFNQGLIPLMEDILQISQERTDLYVELNPWNETRFNIERGLKVDVDVETGEEGPATATKKGAKKDVTERLFKDLKSAGASRQKIIDAFVEQVGMSKAGATTYFHSLKKELGFSEKDNPQQETPKTESKQDLAERLYNESADKSKATLIALFTDKLDTSRLGAQTYYYACKKKFQNATTIQDNTI